MTEYIKAKNYFPVPNSIYVSGLLLYQYEKITDIELQKLFLTRQYLNKEQCYKLKQIKKVKNVPILSVYIDDYYFVFDGHHRTYAAFLRGDKTIKSRLINLNQFYSNNVKRHKDKNKIDLYDISAADLEEAGLL